MHYVGKFREEDLPEPGERFQGHVQGLSQAMLIDSSVGSVHMNLMVNQLKPGGTLDAHIHAFEEGYFFLEGEMIGMIDGHFYRLGPGDYCITSVGTPHAWRNASSAPVRWVEMFSPQPSATGHGRAVYLGRNSAPLTGEPIAALGPRAKYVGHFDESELPPPLTTRGGRLRNWSLKMMVDGSLGAQHLQMFIVEFAPGGTAALHDHPLEEAYFILSGEVVAEIEGKDYLLTPGSVAWASVGAAHAFRNEGRVPVRWLEVQAPQPPAQQAQRYPDDWRRLGEELTQ